MIITIDPGSRVPPYEQLRSQVSTLIRTGALEDGWRMPSIRQLAEDLQIAPGTVAKAYRELEQEGLLVTVGRRGTRVRAPANAPSAERRERLRQAARLFAAEARQLGVPAEHAIREVTAALAAPAPPPHPAP